ncbi:MAG: hypothetical protein JSU59_08665 [Nitrospirota bacterium]|nr:MAG: hypothetical protein JSU59_08665 [Nitrospirota bacterium]
MPFAYYHRLTANEKKIYRRSDQITVIHIPQRHSVRAIVEELARALKQEDREKTQTQAQSLINTIVDGLHVPRVRVKVLQTRPSNEGGELHGLYNPQEEQKSPRVTLWMRTAKRRQVVAFRTFLRTLLHELCHHLDYTLLGLKETFHTEGFYKRESSLLHQLLPQNENPLAKTARKAPNE